MFPLSPDGWMNEKVNANPDIPISSNSPIVRLWFSSSPTVPNVDDDPRKWDLEQIRDRGHNVGMCAVREYVLDSLVQVLVPISTRISPRALVKGGESTYANAIISGYLSPISDKTP